MNQLTRIMIVEDEPDLREIAQMTLQELGGFDITLCSSGAEALTQIKKEPPQLILLDVMMPNMDGPTTLAKIREMPEGKDIPIIFMTARVTTKEVQSYLDLGSIGVIPKPFDPQTLPKEVMKFWQDNHDPMH